MITGTTRPPRKSREYRESFLRRVRCRFGRHTLVYYKAVDQIVTFGTGSLEVEIESCTVYGKRCLHCGHAPIGSTPVVLPVE